MLTGKRKTLLVAIEILLLIALLLPVIRGIAQPEQVNINLQDWHTQAAVYEDGWRIDETMSFGSASFLYGPYAHLDKGSYRVRIDYEADSDQSFYPYARFSNIVYIEGGEARLPKNLTSVEYDFTLTEAVEQFELVVDYNGQGEMLVRDITISKTPHAALRTLLTAAFFLLILNVLLFAPGVEKNKNTLLAVLGITMLASLPLFVKGVANGHDLSFHLLRIEGMAQEISLGNLPVRLHSLYMDGHGYPVSVYYGDLLLYLPALLRLAGFPVVTAYKIYVFAINAATAAVSACCFGRMFRERRTALLAALAYTTANYRLVDIYVRASVGEYTAMLFLPVVALAVYRIYTQKENLFRNAVMLAAGMTGVIITHVLSAEMTVIALGLCCIILWKKTLKKPVLLTYAIAVGLTVLLCLFFVVPLADYYLTVPANINSTVSGTVMKMQNNGAYIGDYFAFFKGVFGDGSAVDAGWRMALTPGAALMAVLVAAAALWINRKASPAMKLTTVLAVLMLWMASTLFPWNALAAHSRVGRLFSTIQFPWRYLGFAVLFLSVLLGQVLDHVEIKQGVLTVCLALCLLVPLSFMSSYSDDLGVEFDTLIAYDTAELNTSTITAMEYLRAGSSLQELSSEVKGAELISRSGPKMVLRCDNAGTVEVPMFNYKGYRVTDETGREYVITDGPNNLICFEVPENFSGEITVDFVEPWYWRAAEAVSVFTLFGLILLWKKTHKKPAG